MISRLSLRGSPAGNYTVIIDNAPAEYTVGGYSLDSAPRLSGVTTSRTGDNVAIDWKASDTDSPNAKVTVSYGKVIPGTNTIDEGATYTLAENLPLSAHHLDWDLSEVPTGKYRVVVVVDDGKNVPTDDKNAPSIVTASRS